LITQPYAEYIGWVSILNKQYKVLIHDKVWKDDTNNLTITLTRDSSSPFGDVVVIGFIHPKNE
jgi:hypothetical protein